MFGSVLLLKYLNIYTGWLEMGQTNTGRLELLPGLPVVICSIKVTINGSSNKMIKNIS